MVGLGSVANGLRMARISGALPKRSGAPRWQGAPAARAGSSASRRTGTSIRTGPSCGQRLAQRALQRVGAVGAHRGIPNVLPSSAKSGSSAPRRCVRPPNDSLLDALARCRTRRRRTRRSRRRCCAGPRSRAPGTLNMKPPSPLIETTLLVRVADLRAERGREAVAERALVARADEGARLVDREAAPRPVADLGALVDDDRVVRAARVADRQRRAACGWTAFSVVGQRLLERARLRPRRDGALPIVRADPLGQRGQGRASRRRRCRRSASTSRSNWSGSASIRISVAPGGDADRRAAEADAAASRPPARRRVLGSSSRSAELDRAPAGAGPRARRARCPTSRPARRSGSARARSSSQASAASTPPPAMISGRSALPSSFSRLLQQARVAGGRCRRQRLAQLDVGLALASTSGGISIATGRGRPLRSCRNASCTRPALGGRHRARRPTW